MKIKEQTKQEFEFHFQRVFLILAASLKFFLANSKAKIVAFYFKNQIRLLFAGPFRRNSLSLAIFLDDS